MGGPERVLAERTTDDTSGAEGVSAPVLRHLLADPGLGLG